MTVPCPSCGSTRNAPGAVVCAACHALLPKSVIKPISPGGATLVTSSGRKYTLSSVTPMLIGGRGCAILLSGSGIEPQHAKLTPSGGGFQIESLMGTVLVNGKIISTATYLISGSTITIGSVVLSYVGPAGSPSTTLAPASSPMISSSKAKITKTVKLPPPTRTPTALEKFISGLVKPVPSLDGHILLVDGPHPEQPDIDWAGLLLRGWIGLMLSPIVILLFFLQPALIIPFFLYGRGQRDPQVPARFLRVEDRTGKTHIVKMKGDINEGMLSQGDDASFWGKWKGGTLLMDRAWNQTANSQVGLKPVIQRKVTTGILVAVLVLSGFCWLSVMLGSASGY